MDSTTHFPDDVKATLLKSFSEKSAFSIEMWAWRQEVLREKVVLITRCGCNTLLKEPEYLRNFWWEAMIPYQLAIAKMLRDLLHASYPGVSDDEWRRAASKLSQRAYDEWRKLTPASQIGMCPLYLSSLGPKHT